MAATPHSSRLIAIFKEDIGPSLLKSKGIKANELSGKQKEITDLFKGAGITITPLTREPEKIKALQQMGISVANQPATRLDRFYSIQTEDPADLEAINARLKELDVIEASYYKPLSTPPLFLGGVHAGSLKRAGTSLKLTDDLSSHQTYLNAAPDGVDARFAWTIVGGRGKGVKVIDVEGGWNLIHEDLSENSLGLLAGFNYNEYDWFQHGTAVLGEMGGDANKMGIEGICPEASIGAISVFENSNLNENTSAAIIHAANTLEPGDILLLEQHRPGPASIDPSDGSQQGFIAIEWWPDDFAAIQYATAKGIIVIEAAGNGAENLDSSIYDTPQEGFPDWWVNPFKRQEGMDSGAIIVGAGAPPPGTNGQNWGPARSRLDFSNYGSCVDVQGWGRSVTTAGYGDITGETGDDMTQWYTDSFAGTSSASPIVTGVAACLQGIQRAAGRPLLTPLQLRELLHITGSAQQDAPGAPKTENIGNLPDLQQLIASL